MAKVARVAGVVTVQEWQGWGGCEGGEGGEGREAGAFFARQYRRVLLSAIEQRYLLTNIVFVI